MKIKYLVRAALLAFACFQAEANATSILGSAQDFAVLGGSTVSNTGTTTIYGDVGLYPGPSIVGFAIPPANTVLQGSGSTGLVAGPGLVAGTIYISHAVALQAQTDAQTAYNALQALTPGSTLPGTAGQLC